MGYTQIPLHCFEVVPTQTQVDNIYYYQDELGSTSHIASSSGALLEYYKYDLYGKPTYWSPSTPSSQRQASAHGVVDLGNGGARWIPQLGLYDDRNRFMSPDLGRFLQPDPIGFKGDASNLYRYCGNDWANKTDPMGLTEAQPMPKPELSEQLKEKGKIGGDRDRGSLAEYAMLTGSILRIQVFKQPDAKCAEAGIHDPVINGKNYDQSKDYHALGEAAAERAERKLMDNPRDFEEKIYIGQNQNGSRDFIAEHDPRPQYHDPKTGENYTRVYDKRHDPKGEGDPLRGTGYRTMGVAIAKKRFEWGHVRQSDVKAIKSSGLDGWVSYPPTGGNDVIIRFVPGGE